MTIDTSAAALLKLADRLQGDPADGETAWQEAISQAEGVLRALAAQAPAPAGGHVTTKTEHPDSRDVSPAALAETATQLSEMINNRPGDENPNYRKEPDHWLCVLARAASRMDRVAAPAPVEGNLKEAERRIFDWLWTHEIGHWRQSHERAAAALAEIVAPFMRQPGPVTEEPKAK